MLSFYLLLIIFLLIVEQHLLKSSISISNYRVALISSILILLILNNLIASITAARERLKLYSILSSTTRSVISSLTYMALPFLLIWSQKYTVKVAKPVQQSA